jgi:hypothetical protein
MLKGHAKIELKNEKTGKLDVIEHDNMITNALNSQLELISHFFGSSILNSEYFPLNNKGMGGIVLFQDRLDEESSNINMPRESDNAIIGYASNDVNPGTDTKRGSRNLTESEKLDNGYKFVWDFTTSQANGQISALALTHMYSGINPKGSGNNLTGSSIRLSIGDTNTDNNRILQNCINFDWDTSILTCIITVNETTIRVNKYKLEISNILGINSTIGNLKLLTSQDITLASSIAVNTVWLNGQDGYFYGVYILSGSCKIVRIESSTYKLDTSYSVNLSGIPSNFTVSKGAYPYYSRGATCVNQGKLYALSGKQLLELNLSDSTFTTHTLTVDIGSSPQSIISLTVHNGLMYAHRYYIDMDTNFNIIVRKTNSSSNDIFSKQNYGAIYRETVFIRDDGIGVSINGTDNGTLCTIGNFRDYLATINNLDSPVIKTSEQSMKITYTITEE